MDAALRLGSRPQGTDVVQAVQALIEDPARTTERGHYLGPRQSTLSSMLSGLPASRARPSPASPTIYRRPIAIGTLQEGNEWPSRNRV